jgi:hypothetical protein
MTHLVLGHNHHVMDRMFLMILLMGLKLNAPREVRCFYSVGRKRSTCLCVYSYIILIKSNENTKNKMSFDI